MTAIAKLPFPENDAARRHGSKPVEVGGLIRVDCHDARGQRVDAAVRVERIQRLGCGCWEVTSTRPGECRARTMCSIFQRCRMAHDDGGGPGVLDRQPQVLRYGPA